MRTTLDIDDDLLDALLSRHPGTSKTQAIEDAIRARGEELLPELARYKPG